MKDRIPTKVAPNGAIRYGVYTEQGVFLRYEYFKPEDEPSQEGTPLNKATLLSDATDALYGLGADAVPDDVYKVLQQQLFGVGGTKGVIIISVQSSTGTLLAGVDVTVSGGTSGKKYTSGEDGTVVADTSTASTTLTTDSSFADLVAANVTISTPLNSITKVTLVVGLASFLKVTTSSSLKFSSLCKKVHVTAVGGGGGGGEYSQAAGGGGGGYCTVTNNVAFVQSTAYSAIVGGGGNSAYTVGKAGGTSSFLGVSANGGSGGGVDSNTATGGSGNGAGGEGRWTNAANTCGSGTSGSVQGFSSATTTVLYGGGGGGKGGSRDATSNPGNGGSGYGARGGNPAADGFGGGGGGNAKGGSGCIAIRMEH